MRSLISWGLGIPVFLLTAFYTVILSLFIPPKQFYGLLRGSCRLILWICGIRVKVENAHYFTPGQTYLIMANHVNLFDSLILAGYIPTVIVGVEKGSHFKWPIYGLLIRRFGNIPISQGNMAEVKKSIARAVDTFKNGTCVLMLPEGTRTRTGQMGVFKKGAFHLALDAEATILPLTLRDLYAINQTGSWLIRTGTVSLIYSEPIVTTGYTKENLNELVERVRTAIAKPLDVQSMD